MSLELLIQLIASFLIGGGLIAILSVLAEKVPQRYSGLILSLPTTIILGYFFLGYSQSSQAVAHIVPASLPALGLAVLYPLIYVHLAAYFDSHQLLKTKGWTIFYCFSLSAILWFLAALPLVLLKHTHLPAGIIIYLVLTLIAHFALRKKTLKKFSARKYSRGSILLRAMFVGFLISIVCFLAETMNPFWAGVIAMFPAGLASSLIVIHWSNKSDYLFSVVRNVPMGSISVFAYALGAMLFFSDAGIYWGTFLSLLPSLMAVSTLAWIQNSKN